MRAEYTILFAQIIIGRNFTALKTSLLRAKASSPTKRSSSQRKQEKIFFKDDAMG